MARRSDHSREELKEMCINAGQKLVIEGGLAALSARKVAKEIGYTVGTIYNIFDNHDDLILHINSVTLQDLADYIAKKVSIDQTGTNALHDLAKAYITFAKNDYHRWSALFEHNLPQGQPLPDWYLKEVNQLFTIVERYFAGIVDAQKVETSAKTIWAGVHGICQLSLSGKLDTIGVKSIEELTDSLINNYVRGLSS